MQNYGLGAVKDKRDRHDYMVEDILGGAKSLPLEYSVAEIEWIKSQKKLPTCVAETTTITKEPQEGKRLSSRDLYSRCKQFDGNTKWGTSFRTAQQVMQKQGVAEESLMPSNSSLKLFEYLFFDRNQKQIENAKEHRNKSYYSIGKKVLHPDYFETVRQAMFQFKARVVCGCNWYKSYNKLKSPYIMTDPYDDYLGGHAWCINGWKRINNVPVLVAINSFSDKWGDNGVMYLTKEWFNKHAYFGWIHIDLPKHLPVDKYYGQKRTWNCFLLEQAVAFNPWLFGKIKRLPSNREISGLAHGYWDFDAVYHKRVKDLWLYVTKPEWNRLVGLYGKKKAIKIIKE